jgi:basic membrane protein A
MDGYALGAEYFNARHGATVEVLGWDPWTQTGLLLDWEFGNLPLGYATTMGLFDSGADTVFAVAGPTGLGSLAAAADRKAAGEVVRVIEPDFDWFILDRDPSRVLLTSVVKNVDVAVYNNIHALVTGTWTPGWTWEDLASGGVDLAPFHKTHNQVRGIARELRMLRAGIIDGSIDTLPYGLP